MKEKQHLEETIKKYDEVIEDSKLKMKNLKKFYNNYDEMMTEKEKLEHKIKKITESKETPYFARIDFETNKKETLINNNNNKYNILSYSKEKIISPKIMYQSKNNLQRLRENNQKTI